MKRMPIAVKRLLSLCLVAALCLGFWVPMRAQAATLLGNGSFDEPVTPLAGDGTALSTGSWTSVSWAFGINEAANAHTGSNLAHLVYATDGLGAGEFPCIYQDVAVQKNAVYRLTFWAKHWNVNAAAQPLYYGFRNSLQDVWVPVEQYMVSDLDNNYRQITLEFSTRELTNIRIFAFTTTTAGGFGGYHLDDFSLELVRLDAAEESGGLLTDGSFNNPMTVMGDANAQSTGKWTSMSWASANQELANAYAGKGLAHLVCAANGLPAGEFPTIYQDVTVQPHSIYKLTFWAKKWNFGATTAPLYYGYRNSAQDVWTPVEQYEISDLNGTYRQITLEFDTKELTSIRVFAFTQSVAGGAAGYHLDNFKLELVRANPAEEAGGLLTDGSFNNPMTVMGDANAQSIGKWTSMSWASANKELANARSGEGLANVIYAADGLPAGEFPTIYQDVTVQPHSIYKLTFWAKNWNFGAAVQPLYYGYRNSLQDVWTPVEQYAVSDLDGTYRQITLEFDTKELTSIRVFAFTTAVAGGVGGYHLDDFKLEYVREGEIPETEDPDALLKNGGFIRDLTVMTDPNAQSTGNWTTMSWASAVYEKDNARTGKGLANLVYSADGLPAGEFPTIYQDVAVQPHSIYKLTFWAKNWNIGAAVQPLYYGYRNSLQDVWTPVEQYEISDLDGTYRQITLEFDTKELTDLRIFAFTTAAAGGAGGYHLDDFTLEYVRQAPPAEQEDPDALLKNGSFLRDMTVMTDGKLPSKGNWTTMSWSSTIYEKDNAYTGESLCNMVISAPGLPAGEFPTIYQDVDVKKNSAYTVTFYAKYWSVNGKKAPLYYGFRNGEKDVWVPVEEFKTTSIGNEYEKITFTIHTGNVKVARIFAFTTALASDGISGYHLDGFHMEYEGPYYSGPFVATSKDVDPDNLVYDSGFEAGDSQLIPAQPRDFAGVWTKMSVVGVDGGSQFSHTGKSSLFMAYAAEGMPKGDYPTVWQDIRVEKNTWYEMSFYIKQWGVDPADDKLYYGFRDPMDSDIWTNRAEFTKTEFSEEYKRVTCRFQTGDRDVIRLFFCIVALDFNAVGGAGGYHIDNVKLQKLSAPTAADFTLSGKAVAGTAVDYRATADLQNGKKDVSLTHGEGTAITFESRDEGIVTCDFNGTLIAAAPGTTQVRVGITRNGVTAWSDWKDITVAENENTYLAKVEPQIQGDLTTGVYVPLSYLITGSDGNSVAAGGCTVTVASSDPDVVWVKQKNDGYVLYGTGCGSATVCITAQKDGSVTVGKLNFTVEDGNFLKDSSFEMQTQAAPYWKITGTAAYGVDDSSTNQLSRTGDANLWMAAPISWSDAVKPGSDLEITQYVSLEPGSYTLSAYINRFYATGMEGILSELGGLVQVGLEDSQGKVQMAEYDVTYGVGRYQELTAYITAEAADTYKVFIRIQGDEQFGLGMQLEDVTLKATQFPTEVTVTAKDTQVGAMTQLTVTACYADGTQVVLEDGFTVSVSDEKIAKSAGRNLVGVAPGAVTVTVQAQVAGKSYTAQCQITVTGEEAPQTPVVIQPEEPGNWYMYPIIAVAVLIAAAVVVILIKKKRS